MTAPGPKDEKSRAGNDNLAINPLLPPRVTMIQLWPMFIVSMLFGCIFIVNANYHKRRSDMSEREIKIDDDRIRKLTDEGW
jgi:hypothetical protein